jgi:hypothetical protein
MRHRAIGLCLVAGVGALCIAGSWTPSQAQDGNLGTAKLSKGTITLAAPAKFRIGFAKGDVAGSIRAAAAAIGEAADAEAKAAAEKNLAELLDKVFEDDLKRREAELAKIEDRLKKLRALVALRREKKQEIIDLQRNVVLHEAAGLGFYDQPSEPVGKKLGGMVFDGGYGADASTPVGNDFEGGGEFDAGYGADASTLAPSSASPFREVESPTDNPFGSF